MGLVAQQLAQTSSNGASGTVVVWVLVLLVVIVVAFGLLLLARKMLANGGEDDSSSSMSMAFTMSDLRQLHADGQLTDAEFERARASMLARHRAANPETTPTSDTQAGEFDEFIDRDDDGTGDGDGDGDDSNNASDDDRP